MACAGNVQSRRAKGLCWERTLSVIVSGIMWATTAAGEGGVGQMYRKRAQVLLDRTAEVSDERTAEASPGVVRIGLQVSLLRGRAGNG